MKKILGLLTALLYHTHNMNKILRFGKKPTKRTLIASILIALIIGISLFFVTCGSGEIPTPGVIIVNSSEDSNSRNEFLSFREAILLSEGTLKFDELTIEEKNQVQGTVGAGLADNILFTPGLTILLSDDLPTIADDKTTIKGPVTISGRDALFGLGVTAREFTMEDKVVLVHCISPSLKIDNTSDKERRYKLVNLEIKQGQKGAVFYLKGTGKVTLDLSDCVFSSLAQGLEITGSAEGNYNIIKNTYQDLREVGAKLTLGGGSGNIILNYKQNRHSNNKLGTEVTENQQTGQISWNFEGNLWQNGTDALTANFRVAGDKNFLDDTAKINSGIGLYLTCNPFPGNTITASLNGEVLKNNGTGVQYSVQGKVEISQRFFTLSENKNAGIDLVANADAQGKWMDNNSNYIGNLGIGIRLVNLGGAVDFGIFNNLIKDNYDIGIVSIGFKFSGTVQNSTITNNTYGVRLTDSAVWLSNNSICFNSIDGVLIEGDSQIFLYPSNILDQNGEYEVHNNSPNDIAAYSNDWGPENTIEMQTLPFPSDITKIYDYFDNPASGLVNYESWIEEPMGCHYPS